MEIKKLIGPALIALPLCLFSCIKDEAPNIEADIEQMTITQDFALINGIPKPSDFEITVMLRRGLINLKKDLAPQFVLSPGATISPASGDTIDFTNPVEYTVTSQDKRYQNKYTIRFKDITPLPTHYTFEHWRTDSNGKYYIPYEVNTINITPDSIVKDSSEIWASGNSAFILVAGSRPPSAYPTRYIELGPPYGKKALSLETLSTGSFYPPMPLAAGNLFIGTFDLKNAMLKPLEATHFGKPFENGEPLKFSFYYNYKPVAISPEVMDECDIYAVLFETDETVEYLDGTNVLTHPNIVALARISNPGETKGNNLVYNEVEFNYRKKFDPQKMENLNYSLAVVFSSSRRGAEFIGGIGSTLIVDEAIVTCKK